MQLGRYTSIQRTHAELSTSCSEIRVAVAVQATIGELVATATSWNQTRIMS
jgi:hypothetical protein